jgi:hypothetical protein
MNVAYETIVGAYRSIHIGVVAPAQMRCSIFTWIHDARLAWLGRFYAAARQGAGKPEFLASMAISYRVAAKHVHVAGSALRGARFDRFGGDPGALVHGFTTVRFAGKAIGGPLKGYPEREIEIIDIITLIQEPFDTVETGYGDAASEKDRCTRHEGRISGTERIEHCWFIWRRIHWERGLDCWYALAAPHQEAESEHEPDGGWRKRRGH